MLAVKSSFFHHFFNPFIHFITLSKGLLKIEESCKNQMINIVIQNQNTMYSHMPPDEALFHNYAAFFGLNSIQLNKIKVVYVS